VNQKSKFFGVRNLEGFLGAARARSASGEHCASTARAQRERCTRGRRPRALRARPEAARAAQLI
jgi:hypothetical protein